MPIYEYQCDACGHHFERMQRIKDNVLTDCPKCDKSALRKLMSQTSFQLKGSGWYQTDFKHVGQPPPAETDTKTTPQEGATAAQSSTDSTKTAEKHVETKSSGTKDVAGDKQTE